MLPNDNGATEIVHNTAANGQQFNSTFKIKGQAYHKVGSLLSMPNEPHTFLHLYFMGDEDINNPELQMRRFTSRLQQSQFVSSQAHRRRTGRPIK